MATGRLRGSLRRPVRADTGFRRPNAGTTMKQRVIGLDREGRSAALTVDAATPALAERAALAHGFVLVERVTPEPPADAVEALAERSQRRPVLIELTAKRWKLGILLSVVLVLAGAVVCAAGLAMSLIAMKVAGTPAFVAIVGASMAVVGFALSMIYQLLAWWHHG